MQSRTLTLPLQSPQGSQRAVPTISKQFEAAQNVSSLPVSVFSGSEAAASSPPALAAVGTNAAHAVEEPNEAQAFAQEAAQLQKFAQNLKVQAWLALACLLRSDAVPSPCLTSCQEVAYHDCQAVQLTRMQDCSIFLAAMLSSCILSLANAAVSASFRLAQGAALQQQCGCRRMQTAGPCKARQPTWGGR